MHLPSTLPEFLECDFALYRIISASENLTAKLTGNLIKITIGCFVYIKFTLRRYNFVFYCFLVDVIITFHKSNKSIKNNLI